jgi:uncharacterized phage-associated protein
VEKQSYIRLTSSQIEKVGNTLIYLSDKIGNLSKTKALKLIYILDEISIKQSGIPFFNLKYKVWKFGPVSEELFIDLSSEVTLLKHFIKRSSEDGSTIIEPLGHFNDDEFSDNDIELMDFVVQKFGNQSAKELIFYTHRSNSPWHTTAVANSVLDLLEGEEINNTEIVIDMSLLVSHDERKKAIYKDYLEVN